MNVLVLQQVECEPAATYADVLEANGIGVDVVATDRLDRRLDASAFDALIAMGGPMGVNDGERLPWLRAEQELIRSFVDTGRAVLGVCLGAQLLAASLGAAVYAGPRPEIGVRPVYCTSVGAVDPIFDGLPQTLPALHWHSDTFDLPVGAVLLCSSDAFRHQAFRAGANAYGVQFHLEAPAALVRRWAELPEYGASLERVGGTGIVPQLLADVERHEATMQRNARALVSGWIEHCLLPFGSRAAAR